MELYSATVIYFTPPLDVRVNCFLCFGANRREVKRKVKEYAIVYAKEKNIDYDKLQFNLNNENAAEIQQILNIVQTGIYKASRVKKRKPLSNREKIPLSIGDKTYNL